MKHTTIKKEAYLCVVIDIKRISAFVLSAIIFAVSSKSDPKPVQWQVVKNIDQPTAVDGLQYGNDAQGSAYVAATMYCKDILFSATWQSNLLAIIFPFHTFF